MKTIAILCFALFTLTFTSCDETKKVIDVAGAVQLSGSYKVTEAGETATKNDTISFVLKAIDNSIKGHSGCNTFFGEYSIDLYTLHFNDLAISENYCAEPIMKSERYFMDALKNTGTYLLKNDVLTLYSKTDRSVVLKAMKERNLED